MLTFRKEPKKHGEYGRSERDPSFSATLVQCRYPIVGCIREKRLRFTEKGMQLNNLYVEHVHGIYFLHLVSCAFNATMQ